MSVDICASVISHLYADDTVHSLVDEHVYRDVAPSDIATERIVVQHLGAIPGRHLTATSGYTEALVQINVWGPNRPDVEAVADAIREALDHLTGATVGTPPNEATVAVVILSRDPDEWIPPRQGQEQGIFGARQTARIEHTESIPTFV